MVHVAIYADENYMDDGYIFMGGYVGSEDEWIKIVTPWRAVLAEPPSVPYFSNHGFKSAKWCQENGVSLPDMALLQTKVVKLAGVIAASNLYFPAYSRMWRSHFEAEILDRVLAPRNPKYELLRDPYYFCYERLITLLVNYLPKVNSCLAENERLSPIDVFVDENGKLARKASELFFEIKGLAEPNVKALMGTAAPLDDKITVPLQCADLYLGQQREYYIDKTVTDAMKVLMANPSKPPFSAVGLDHTPDSLRKFAGRLSGLPESQWLQVEKTLHDERTP